MVNKIPAPLRYEASLATAVSEYPVLAPISGHPAELEFLQNYPNPFNPVTTIQFVLHERSHVTLSVCSMLGQMVSPLTQEVKEASYHRVQFAGSGLSSGVCVVRIRAGSFVGTRHMILLR